MSSNVVELDKTFIINQLNTERYEELIVYLNKQFIITKDDQTGKPNLLSVSSDTVDTLSIILATLNNKLTENLITESQLCLLSEVFKSLRNASAFNQDILDKIIEDEYIINSVKKIIETYARHNTSTVKIVMQFLINVVSRNVGATNKVWEILSNVLVELFETSECSYYAAALIYNLVRVNKDLIKHCKGVYSNIIAGVVNEQNDYYLFLLEILLQEIDFMSCYETFEVSQRILILTYLQDLLINNSETFILNTDIVEVLTTQFKTKTDCILKTVANDVDKLEPQEVLMLLEILASLSAQEHHHKHLQEDKSLLINCAFLLKNVHSIGKESENQFTPMQKLSDVTSSSGEAINNPFFGIKARLVQFLANAAWKNRLNQDQLRELDCIPLLLDCCNIDARNPFVMQWTILAVRNLCENNLENQEVVAKMTRQGVVNSSTLQEMGLTLHDDGTNKISLLPYPHQNLK